MIATLHSGRALELKPTPEGHWAHKREETASILFSEQGWDVHRSDTAGRTAVAEKNFSNYGAPTLLLFCVSKQLTDNLQDMASLGVYLGNIMGLLWERGVGSCAQGSVAGYSWVIGEVLDEVAERKWTGKKGLEDDLVVVCGLAVGYADENKRIVGTFRMEKDGYMDHVEFFD
jgi:hypothetical protein